MTEVVTNAVRQDIAVGRQFAAQFRDTWTEMSAAELTTFYACFREMPKVQRAIRDWKAAGGVLAREPTKGYVKLLAAELAVVAQA